MQKEGMAAKKQKKVSSPLMRLVRVFVISSLVLIIYLVGESKINAIFKSTVSLLQDLQWEAALMHPVIVNHSDEIYLAVESDSIIKDLTPTLVKIDSSLAYLCKTYDIDGIDVFMLIVKDSTEAYKINLNQADFKYELESFEDLSPSELIKATLEKNSHAYATYDGNKSTELFATFTPLPQNDKHKVKVSYAVYEKFSHWFDVIKEDLRNNLIVVGILIILTAFFSIRAIRKIVKSEELVKEELKQKNQLVEEKNKEIIDSITYAKRLQDAILPPIRLMKEKLGQSFIVYKPKDIVAGDFYWMEIGEANKRGSELANKPDSEVEREMRSPSGVEVPASNQLILFAAADCTGHGVPGAMVSVVCSNALNRAVKEFRLSEPSLILDKVADLVAQTFEKSDTDVKDGMDISLCSIRYQVESIKTEKNSNFEISNSKLKAVLQWAGANNPLWILRKDSNEIEEVRADKQPIGRYDHRTPFTNHTIHLNEGDTIYIFTDGYADQFGGERGKKFKASKMKELLLSIRNQPMDAQRLSIEKGFESWKGTLEQVDDVCVIGVRI